MKKNILPIAVLIIACSVAYHYIVYIPNRDELNRKDRQQSDQNDVMLEKQKAIDSKLAEYKRICAKDEENNMKSLMGIMSVCGNEACRDKAISMVPVGSDFMSACVSGFIKGTRQY